MICCFVCAPFLTSFVLGLAAFLEVNEDFGEMVHVLAIKDANGTLSDKISELQY